MEVRENIPIFSEDRYWGKSPESVLKRGLRIIEKKGWEEFNKRFCGKLDFTDDESRADWRFNIPITKDFVVLDAGAGMGRVTIPLARVVKRMVAFDHSFSRMSFLQRRLVKEGIKNVDLCVADIFELPFKKESFDLIVMNGVLEWMGKNKFFGNPRQAQIASLKICRKLLKRNGYLYVGIENRWALSYLRGLDHSGLRYTSYMPRWLASIYCRIRGKGNKYDTLTYSKSGYIKLIEESGFRKSNINFYLPYPGYNIPRIIVPYEHFNLLKYLVVNLMASKDLKTTLVKALAKFNVFIRLYRLLFFSFNIIIKK